MYLYVSIQDSDVIVLCLWLLLSVVDMFILKFLVAISCTQQPTDLVHFYPVSQCAVLYAAVARFSLC
jgi:hypothetical protein